VSREDLDSLITSERRKMKIARQTSSHLALLSQRCCEEMRRVSKVTDSGRKEKARERGPKYCLIKSECRG
jgi:hypothetical protein